MCFFYYVASAFDQVTCLRFDAIILPFIQRATMKASTASCLAALIVARYCGGGECAGSLTAVPTAFVHPRERQRQTIGGATATTMATTKSVPALVTLFASENEDDDIGGDEGMRSEEELIGEGKPIELESLRGQSASFMGLEPLSDGEDPFDNGVPLVTGTIVLFISTWLTLAPFFMDLDAPDLPPPPGM